MNNVQIKLNFGKYLVVFMEFSVGQQQKVVLTLFKILNNQSVIARKGFLYKIPFLKYLMTPCRSIEYVHYTPLS